MTEADNNLAMLLNIALNGNGMTRKQASLLAKELELDESQIVPRVKLLGYCFTRYLTSSTIRLNRKTHIFWLIDKMADNEFLTHPFAIILKDVDLNNNDYDEYKELWKSKIDENPTSISILLNAALALSFSDLELSHDIVKKARETAPEDDRIQKVTEVISHRRTDSHK